MNIGGNALTKWTLLSGLALAIAALIIVRPVLAQEDSSSTSAEASSSLAKVISFRSFPGLESGSAPA